MSCTSHPRGVTVRVCLFLLALLVVTAPLTAGQNKVRRINGEGNKLYTEEQWADALAQYTAANEIDPENPVLHYNLGNALYRINDLEQAVTHYTAAAASEDQELARRARFNLGNTWFRNAEALEGTGDWEGRNKALAQSIGHWQSVLTEEPGNRDAKLNLELALKKLQEEPPENQQQQDQEGEQDEQEKDQQEEQDQQQDQEGEQGEEEQDQQQQKEGEQEQDQQEEQPQSGEEKEEDQEQQGETQQPQPGEEQEQQAGEEQAEQMRISPEEAQRILDALRDEELEEQRRQMAERKGKGGSAEKDW